MSGQSTSTDAAISPLVQATVLSLLDQAIDHGTSAIHIEPRQRLTVVRFRTDGSMHTITKLPANHHQAVVDYVRSLITEVEPDTGVGSFTQTNNSGLYLVQVVITPVLAGERVVLHLSPQSGQAKTLAELGFWGHGLAAVEHALCQPHGLILSGSIDPSSLKQTNQALIEALQTVQRPVIDINPPAGLSLDTIRSSSFQTDQFSDRLNWALQQDEEVIVVGHLNAGDSIALTFETALSQKLLLATISAASVARQLRRLLEAGAATHLIGASLRLAVTTKPVRQLCAQCRESYQPTKAMWPRLAKAMGLTEKAFYQQLHELEQTAQADLGQDLSDLSSSPNGIGRLWRPSAVGCQDCHFSGYHGQVLLTEVLEPTAEIQRALVLNYSAKQIQAAVRAAGTIGLEMDGLVKALRGLTSLEEIVGKRYR